MTDSNRRLVSLLLLLGAALSLLAGAAVVSQRQMRLRGALNGLPDMGLPPRVPILGVNADLAAYSPDELATNLDLMANIGFVWVRQVFAWDRIEPQRGLYQWDAYDEVVGDASARGLNIVAVLWRSPRWAAADPTAPPDDWSDFAGYVRALAERYGDRIDVYQVWDEPNLMSGWGGQRPDPVGYMAMLQAAYEVIHAVDPEAVVLTAGLAPTVETGPDNLSDILYLRALYANGAAPFFDGVAGKPYGFDSGPDDRRVDPNLLNFSRFVLLREEMVRHGDEGKPLWASHFGWNALPPGWGGQPSIWGLTSAQQQAEWTLEAYQRALIEWPWSGALIVENWQPASSPDDARWGFALRTQDGQLSPTAEALRAHSDLFNTALWPGVYPADVPLAEYSGEWEFSELGADIVENGSSVVEVPFAGSSLAVIARRDNYRAYLYITVDGQESGILPRDERGSYAVLTSPDYQPRVEPIVLASHLEPQTQHLAHIEAERGWDQWAIAGFSVGSEINTTAYDVLVVGTALLAGGLAAGAFRIGGVGIIPTLVTQAAASLRDRLSEGAHLILSLAASLAIWLGAALTWGGLITNLVRRLGDGPSLLITALTAGVFYFSPWFLLTIVALAVLFMLIYARPAVGLALVMFFTPYYLLPRPLFDRMFSMVEVTSLLTLLAWGIHTIAQRRAAGWPGLHDLYARMTNLDKAVALLVMLSVLSLSWAELRGVAITELRQMVLEPMVMYLVLRTMPLTPAERWRMVDLLILTGVVVSIVGFYQSATGTDLIIAEAGTARLRSVFGTPNNAALFLERLIPITAAIVLIGSEPPRRWLYGIGGLLMLAAVVLTRSKGGLLLGLPAGLGLVLILWGGRPALIAVLGGVVLEAVALIPLSQYPRFSDLLDFSSGDSSSFFRIQLYQSTLRMIADHPLTGVGLDQFLYQYRGRYILPSAWQQPDLSQPHNFLLNYWARLGILGLAAGVWIQIVFWRLAWQLQRAFRDANSSTRALIVGLMGSMAAFIAHGLVDEVHFVIDLAFIFYMTLGLVHQIGREVSASALPEHHPVC
mgnify:CR=1 FL=1